MFQTQFYSYIEIKPTIFAKIDFLVQKVDFIPLERVEPIIRPWMNDFAENVRKK
jgi:hypothetical protein